MENTKEKKNMKHYMIIGMLVCGLTGCGQQRTASDFNVDEALGYCTAQVSRALEAMKDSTGHYDYTMEPRNILDGDTVWNCRKASAEEWCSGFWPGILWMDYEQTKDAAVRQAAEGFTQSLAFLADRPAHDHDLGFLTIGSFLKGYEALQAGEQGAGMQATADTYRRIALAAADTLATLYNEKVGTLLSWPRHVKDYGGHNTIMDNMMNLELLFWADSVRCSADDQKSADRPLRDIAVSHAATTMQHQFRKDGSCFHVAVYDTLTGEFIRGVTHQGYADSSMWSRGQSWAVYGYTMVYRYTRDHRFLDFAQKVTDIYLKRLRETSDDWVPLWDMDDPRGLEAPKDASAACVVASALLELCQYVDAEKGRDYRTAAVQMLRDLSTDKYQSRQKNVAFLLHSTGHHPASSEVDASIIYADYYYLEALLRLKMIHQP